MEYQLYELIKRIFSLANFNKLRVELFDQRKKTSCHYLHFSLPMFDYIKESHLHSTSAT